MSVKKPCAVDCQCMRCQAYRSGLPVIDKETMTKTEFTAIPQPILFRSLVIGREFKPEPMSDLSKCGGACNCIGCRAAAIAVANQPKPVLDIPRYMFAERPVTPSTWIELQNMQLDTYMLTGRTALLVDPVTREYCYVYWDEADQCSNPYATQIEARSACIAYVAQL